MPIILSGKAGMAFIDSGCTFNAISTAYAQKCNQDIIDTQENIQITVGGGHVLEMKRRISDVLFDLGDLGLFSTIVFVMEHIPLKCDAIFGMDFLEKFNPSICWKNKILNNGQPVISQLNSDEDQCQVKMCQYVYQDHISASGNTRIINNSELLDQELKSFKMGSADAFCFFIKPVDQTEKVKRFEDQNWDSLKTNPAYPVLLKFKDTVFKSTLTQADIQGRSAQRDIQHQIDLTDTTPFAVKQFRLSPSQKESVKLWVEEMLTAGLIRKSTSPFNSPIFCIKKPIGWRIVMDYRLLNSRTKIPQEPMPRKEDILNAMQGCFWFSCMDLLSGYYQQLIRECDRQFTAFSTPSGHYEYIVMAQGLNGAPASFNRWIQGIFENVREFCRAYFDDIYCFTRSVELHDHLNALQKILELCEKRGLCLKLSKCVFAAVEIPVLGDFVGRQGVRMDPDKIQIFKNWPVPKTTKELKSFLGSIVYCSRFCAQYGILVTPLQNALGGKNKNDKLVLTDGEILAFRRLVEAMCNTPVLALPDFSKRFGIRMDASDFAIGGVLYQLDDKGEEHPIAFTGRKLTTPFVRRSCSRLFIHYKHGDHICLTTLLPLKPTINRYKIF